MDDSWMTHGVETLAWAAAEVRSFSFFFMRGFFFLFIIAYVEEEEE